MTQKIQLGTPTPRQLALMLADHPAVKAVTQDGVTWKVFPKDTTKRPIFFTSVRFGNGVTLANILRDLRRSGIDLERPEPAPAAPTTKEAPVAAPSPKDMPTVTRLPRDAREEIAELREMVRRSTEANASEVGAALGMLAEADRRIAELEKRVRRLEGATEPRAKTSTEVITDAVLAFLATAPGIRFTPAMVEANIGDQLPADRGKGTTSTIMRGMAERGEIQSLVQRAGGRGPGGNPPLYWMDPPKE